MKRLGMGGVVIACCLMLLASAALADKAEIEKKAQETKVTLSVKDVPANTALDLIAKISGITIKKTDIPKDTPKVTAELKEVTFIEVLKFVTKAAGLSYAIVDDGIEVSGKKKD